MGCVAVWDVWQYGMCGSMGCVAVWDVWQYGMCGSMTFGFQLKSHYRVLMDVV